MRVEPEDIKLVCKTCGAYAFIQVVILPRKSLSLAPYPTLRLACPNRDDVPHVGQTDFELESN